MRLTIKATLLGVFALLLAMLTLQGWMAVRSSADIFADVERFAEDWLPSVEVANKLNVAIADYRIAQNAHVLNTTDDGRSEVDAMIADAGRQVDELSSLYRDLISSPEERALFEEFVRDWGVYIASSQEMLSMSRASRNEEAADLLTGVLRAEYRTVAGELERLVGFNDAGAMESEAAARQEYRFTSLATWVMLAGGMALGAAGMAYAYFGVARPIDRVTDAMTAVSGGDLRAEIPFTGRRDEVGRMAGALSVFRDGLAEAKALREKQASLEQEAAARRKAEMAKMADDFERAAGHIVQMVSSASAELQAAAETLSATSEETNSQASTVSAAALQASTNVQTVAAAVEELVASANEIGSQVSRSNDVAGKAATEAGHTNTRMRGLRDDADRIGKIVNLIEDIAEQTNLLALNATIEASRAGDAGRGFAVVAAEVKGLAGQTAKATSEIAGQINGMQMSSADAAEAIDGIARIIGEVSEIAGAVAAAVEEQRATTSDIAENVHQAARGAEEVTSNIVSVTKAAQESAAAAAQVLSAASELSRQSAALQREVGDFLHTVRAA